MDRPAQPRPVQEYLHQRARTRPPGRRRSVEGLLITGGHDHETSFYTLFEGYKTSTGCRWPQRHGLQERPARQVRRRHHVRLHSRPGREGQEEPARLRRERQRGRRAPSRSAQLPELGLVVPRTRSAAAIGSRRRATVPRRRVKNDQQISVTPGGAHPITAGIAPFHIMDETYKSMWMSPTDPSALDHRQPHQRPDPRLDRSRAERREWSRSSSATAPRRSAIPSYRALVHNAILWAAGRDRVKAATGFIAGCPVDRRERNSR